MTIETKYNIGDKAWINLVTYSNQPHPIRGEIVCCRYTIKEFSQEESYGVFLDFYYYTDVKYVTVDKLFHTKEELLKSL